MSEDKQIFGPQPDRIVDEIEDWEIDNPLFWNNIQENNAAYDGLLQLQADCTPEERATSAKEQGNEFFGMGKKKYDAAIYCYTKGLMEDFDNMPLRTALHANRAMVNLKLENYGKVIADCKRAIQYDPNYVKAYFRAAQANLGLKRYANTIEFCSNGLEVAPDNKPLAKLKKEAEEKLEKYLIVEKRRKEEREKREAAEQKLNNAIEDRKLVMGEASHKTSGEFKGKIHWGEDDELRWPIVFAYPEYSQCDFIESFGEHERFEEHLEIMFPGNEFAFWDEKRRYSKNNLCIYYQTNATDIKGQGKNYKKREWREVKPSLTLLEALQLPDHIIPETPIFSVFVKNSSYLKEFLEKENKN